jgi:hypothetical protein
MRSYKQSQSPPLKRYGRHINLGNSRACYAIVRLLGKSWEIVIQSKWNPIRMSHIGGAQRSLSCTCLLCIASRTLCTKCRASQQQRFHSASYCRLTESINGMSCPSDPVRTHSSNCGSSGGIAADYFPTSSLTRHVGPVSCTWTPQSDQANEVCVCYYSPRGATKAHGPRAH